MCLTVKLDNEHSRKLNEELIRNYDECKSKPPYIIKPLSDERLIPYIESVTKKAETDIITYKAVIACEENYLGKEKEVSYQTLYQATPVSQNTLLSDKDNNIVVDCYGEYENKDKASESKFVGIVTDKSGIDADPQMYLRINGGMFHSFKDKESALKFIDIITTLGFLNFFNFNCMQVYGTKNLVSACKYITLFECKIPKGTDYIEGDFKYDYELSAPSICSKEIVYERNLTDEVSELGLIDKRPITILPTFESCCNISLKDIIDNDLAAPESVDVERTITFPTITKYSSCLTPLDDETKDKLANLK